MRGWGKGKVASFLLNRFISSFQIVLYLLSKAFYFFFPNSGSIFRNAVTTNVMRQHAITMMKNF